MFEKFPKRRVELPESYKKIYEQHYITNREGKSKMTSISSQMESWMHRKAADDLKKDDKETYTLEIGAGTLNHLPYERFNTQYDIVEPFQALFKNSPHLRQIRNIYHDISEIPDNILYNRIISIATLEHICDLPNLIFQSVKHFKPDGNFRVAIPNEGTILWKLGWKLTTGIEFYLKYQLKYSTLMKYEHVNNADEIDEILRYFFNDIHLKVFGISKNIAFYRFYNCSKVNHERINKFVIP